MAVITSSNRTRSGWAEFVRPPWADQVRLRDLMQEPPASHVDRVVAASAIRPPAPSPFAHVLGVDECGAPITDDREVVPCENA